MMFIGFGSGNARLSRVRRGQEDSHLETRVIGCWGARVLGC